MDWSRTKSIFIVVFLILNIFLYKLYLDRHNELNKIEVTDENSIESRLKDDNISYPALQSNIKSAAYIKGKVKTFSDADLAHPNQQIDISEGTHVTATLKKTVKLRNVDDDSSFTDFVQTNVKGGSAYSLWKVNREDRVAIFFQTKNNRLIYYNTNGVVKVYWNENDEVVMYEQTMLEDIKEIKQKDVLPPMQVMQKLHANGLLKTGSRIMQMNLGYSSVVQSAQIRRTQVFVPTWEVRVKTSEGQIEEFFVNAVEGTVIDIQMNKEDVEEDDWGV